jgi:hypothetical protein
MATSSKQTMMPDATTALLATKSNSSSLDEDDNAQADVCSQSTSSMSITPEQHHYLQQSSKSCPAPPEDKQLFDPGYASNSSFMHMDSQGSSSSEPEGERPVTMDEVTPAVVPQQGAAHAHTHQLTPFPDAFHGSPEPVSPSKAHPSNSQSENNLDHHYHLLRQIQEDRVSDDDLSDELLSSSSEEQETIINPPLSRTKERLKGDNGDDDNDGEYFLPQYATTKFFYALSKRLFQEEEMAVATWLGFWALLQVTCANAVLTPMRDAVALQVGVEHMPKLTLASSFLAFLSSVPIGWLFEAPNPKRRKVWKKMLLTRGENQGTSLALFYRAFAFCLLFYAAVFQLVDIVHRYPYLLRFLGLEETNSNSNNSSVASLWGWIPMLLSRCGQLMYIAFFLVVHLMKLHSLSLVWGVTSEAMEYEDVARGHKQQSNAQLLAETKAPKTRLQRLAMVGFGGTIGGILGR